jgi:hypothetical protein
MKGTTWVSIPVLDQLHGALEGGIITDEMMAISGTHL